MLAYIKICKGVLKLEAHFIQIKDISLLGIKPYSYSLPISGPMLKSWQRRMYFTLKNLLPVAACPF